MPVRPHDVSGHVFPVSTAVGRAVERAVGGGDQRPADQRATAAGAPETGGRGVPRAPVQGHVTLGDADDPAAGVAVAGEQRVEAVDTRRTPVSRRHVPLVAERPSALRADEVLDVPEPAVRPSALFGEYYLQHRRHRHQYF